MKSWNKGMKGLQIGGKETQFKKGQTPHNTKPIGFRSYRDGYLVERVEKGFEFVHKLIWKQHHGDIPKGMFVVFKDRNKNNICIENLEIIDRVEHIRRNHIQNLPQELKEVFPIVLMQKIKIFLQSHFVCTVINLLDITSKTQSQIFPSGCWI